MAASTAPLRWLASPSRPPSSRRLTTAWYRPICSGVMLQWSSLSTLSGSSAAISGSLLVRRKMSSPLRARKALSSDRRAPVGTAGGASAVRPAPSLASPARERCSMKALRGADQAGVGEIEDGPEVAETVLDRGAGQGHPGVGGQPPQLLSGVALVVLDDLGLVDDDPPPVDGGQGVDVAHGGGVGGQHHVVSGRQPADGLALGPSRAVMHHHFEAAG